MFIKFIIETDKDQYRVPVSQELYQKNYEYYKGMGLYDDALCQEKALVTTGFRVVHFDGQDS